ncbi:hypothetical protein [Desulfopila sp. IMCC35008]|uniref:hypothetical protein n=1 Tax=Desulfopila sp. IMCC35008 TaxID=2653858 RepID=UPI0013D08D21|nr:hypothetical protein [Desulfopila sp. IMCC35008]
MIHRLRFLPALFFAIVILFFYGCASQSYLPKNAQFDDTFVGIWRGELSLENSKVKRRWKKKRRPDGVLTINIGLYSIDDTYIGRELLSGFWWVQDNHYFEKLPTLNHQVIAHKYEFQEDGSLKLSVQTQDTENREAYSFIEHRQEQKQQ